MSFYAQLLLETENARQNLLNLPIITNVQAGHITQQQYHQFLINAYHHVKHTIPLLMACGSRLSSTQNWLQGAIAEYIEEEIGHDQWILNDITATGGNANEVQHSTPGFAVEMLVAYAYDFIQRCNPIGFFGMVLVLEGTSVALATSVAQIIQDKLGFPNKAFSYLRSHGNLDIEHIDFFRTLMDRIECPEDHGAIVHAANRFYPLYGAVLSAAEETAL